MQSIGRMLTIVPAISNPAEPQFAEAAGGSPHIYPGNETEYECPLCRNTGWRRIELFGVDGMQKCECMPRKQKAKALAVIPERFATCSFASFQPRHPKQEKVLALMKSSIEASWYLTGGYGNGKTLLLYAQYRELIQKGTVQCHVRTTRELIEELRRAEIDEHFASPVMKMAGRREPYHLFWDDIDKIKPTDFKTEVLFHLVDALYRQNHGLTVTSNFSLRDLVEHERMAPAIVRRLDDMCRVLEV